MALQEQEIGVKVTRKEIWKEQLENVTCRVCKEDRELVAHIMCGCRVLLKVQMKCFFLFPNLKEQQKSGRLPFTVS